MKFYGGRHLHATANHPLPVESKGRTFVKDMVVGDEVLKTFEHDKTPTCNKYTVDEAYALGLIICDGCYQSHSLSISLNHNGEQDVIDKLVSVLEKMYPNNTVLAKIQVRGQYEYTDVKVQGAGVGEICKHLQCVFSGTNKIDRIIPQDIFNSSYDVRSAFLSGMLDADGYIRKSTNSNNRTEISIGTMTIAVSTRERLIMNLRFVVSPLSRKRNRAIKINILTSHIHKEPPKVPVYSYH